MELSQDEDKNKWLFILAWHQWRHDTSLLCAFITLTGPCNTITLYVYAYNITNSLLIDDAQALVFTNPSPQDCGEPCEPRSEKLISWYWLDSSALKIAHFYEYKYQIPTWNPSRTL